MAIGYNWYKFLQLEKRSALIILDGRVRLADHHFTHAARAFSAIAMFETRAAVFSPPFVSIWAASLSPDPRSTVPVALVLADDFSRLPGLRIVPMIAA